MTQADWPPRPLATSTAEPALGLAALRTLAENLQAGVVWNLPEPTPAEDLALCHLAKAIASTRATVLLLQAELWSDAGILVRSVIEQLFAYLWVVQDPARQQVRAEMVSLKQAWANAQYLEGLAEQAAPEAQAPLRQAAQAYRAKADALLATLSTQLALPPTKVRREALARVSVKAVEVQLPARLRIAFAQYSGLAHSDGEALAHFRAARGQAYGLQAPPDTLPLAADMHEALWSLAAEVTRRCARLCSPQLAKVFMHPS